MGASSSSYWEWNSDDKLFSQERKSDEMLGARTVRPVDDKFVIDDDFIDSDTVTEWNLSLRSRSFLNRVNDRLRKILDHSLKDAMQDVDKHSMIWWMFMFSTSEAFVVMGKNYSGIYFPSEIQEKISQWNRVTLVFVFTTRFPAGRWSFLVPWRNKVVLKCQRKTRRKMGSSRWIDEDQNSEKADTQFSQQRVRCLEERSKAKEMQNYQYTSVPMGIRLKLFCAQFFLWISSVSTEQSQMCERNTIPVKQERRDPCWQDNLTHRSSQQCYW